MQIDLMATSVVCIVGSAWTEEHFCEQERAFLARVDEVAEVREAKRKLDAATAEVEKFQKRQSDLNARAIALSKTLAESRERLRRAILAGDEFEDKAFTEQGTIEVEFKGCSSALGLLVEEILPEASAILLEAQVDYFGARASGILRLANAHASNIAEQLSALANREGSIEVNVRDVPVISAVLAERGHLIDLESRGRKELAAIRENLKARKGLKAKG